MLSTAAFILIVTSKVVLGQDDREPVDGQIYPLDMAENSVDDWYNGCELNMSALVKRDYLIKEICTNTNFGKAWIISTEKIPGPDKLNMYHLIAIHMYTSPTEMVYKQFNLAVRTGKQNYQNNTYAWYSLHYFLTEAIKTLTENQTKCILTYRGTNVKFNETILNKDIRLGSFASSSTDQIIAKRFGNESCFEIRTCYGANVTKYSSLKHEKEVLIPPYEKFIVTEIIKEGAWCKTVFKLKSSGIKSNLDCEMFRKYHNVIISD